MDETIKDIGISTFLNCFNQENTKVFFMRPMLNFLTLDRTLNPNPTFDVILRIVIH